MQPSEYDIRREVEALRDIRRRSTTPGALALDPDLPPAQNPPSPTSPFQDPSSAPTSPSSSAPGDVSDPFHLFWVPAGLHPEIAPAEFRAFLKEHARNPPSDDDPGGLHRAPSTSSIVPSGLGRKKSMLSRQYQPSENEPAGDDTVIPLRRNKSGIYSSNQNQGPQLTISDLQKLEELAEEASDSDDPAKLRNILRRSLSLNVSPLALDADDLGDEADQPIVVAPPGQFLRRTARTRIRKPGLPGDGGGHRFGERRRGPSARAGTAPLLQRTSSDVSSSDHGDSTESLSATPRPRFSDEGMPEDRPMSFSEEAQIYDAYVRDEDEDSEHAHPPPVLPPTLVTSSPPPTINEFEIPPHTEAPPQQEPEPVVFDVPSPMIHQPQPTRLLSPSPSDPHLAPQPPPSRTPSPSDAAPTSAPDTYSPSASPASSPPSSSFLSTSPPPRKEKDKKGLFGKWGGDKDKDKKTSKKERERLEKERREKEQRDKEPGFLGSLFGKKKHDTPPETTGLHGGREAAQALLGQSQRAPRSPGPPSPLIGAGGMLGGAGGINNYSRYPIHVERAIYRLSHIKLANPRRPLYEQVLISNLMFWYLGVINKAQTGAQAEQGAAPAPAGAAAPGANGHAAGAGQPEGEKEKAERERAEREAAAAAQERAEKERVERERMEREQWEREQREMEMKKRESTPRRGALTKAVPAGGPQQRRAETPIKGPQYEMQHRVMEKEYAGYNGNGPVRANGPPGPGAGSGQGYQRQSPTSPKFNIQPGASQGPENYYFSPGEVVQQQQQQQQQQRLPPGAMPPVDQSSWLAGPPQHSGPPPPQSMNNASQRRSRSPPPPGMNQHAMPAYNPDGGQGGARLGGRSLSATAAMPSPQPPPMNGKIRKGQSAHAGVPSNARRPRADMPPVPNGAGGGGEDEDVPLAVWQRQQRR